MISGAPDKPWPNQPGSEMSLDSNRSSCTVKVGATLTGSGSSFAWTRWGTTDNQLFPNNLLFPDSLETPSAWTVAQVKCYHCYWMGFFGFFFQKAVTNVGYGHDGNLLMATANHLAILWRAVLSEALHSVLDCSGLHQLFPLRGMSLGACKPSSLWYSKDLLRMRLMLTPPHSSRLNSCLRRNARDSMYVT